MLVKIKDPGSAITHFIAMSAAALFAFPLIYKAAGSGGSIKVFSMAVFISSMFLLYCASTVYHTFDISTAVNKILQRIDHSMIFVLIAGSYTPVCLLALAPSKGIPLLIAVWAIGIIGICLTIFLVNCPKWISSIVYIAMGWMCVFVFKSLYTQLPFSAFLWLLAGGIVYTIGGILYALKLPIFRYLPQNFGIHEIFHVFVMGGSLCHYIFMYLYLL